MSGLNRYGRYGRGEDPAKPERSPVWKTIQLGTHRSVEDLRQAILNNGFWIGPSADRILKKVIVAPELTEVKLVKIDPHNELGDSSFSTLWTLSHEEIYDGARELGLGLCPAEVGPQLRLQYSDQPEEDELRIAMEPLMGRAGWPLIFSVIHDYGDMMFDAVYGDKLFRVLDVDYGEPESKQSVYDGARWVFVRQ